VIRPLVRGPCFSVQYVRNSPFSRAKDEDACVANGSGGNGCNDSDSDDDAAKIERVVFDEEYGIVTAIRALAVKSRSKG
jgi:hypothetical protein